MREPEDAVDQIGDVTKRARLRAVAENGERRRRSSACPMNAGTTRPSRNRIRGP